MSAPYLAGSAGPLQHDFDACLFDLDGVVYRGPDPVEHAVEGIAGARAAGLEVVFVTNNANRQPETVAEQLTRLGVPALPDEVMTSAQAAAAMMREELASGARVLPVGGPGLRTALTEAGFSLVDGADDAPDAVVQGFSPQVGWTDLAEAAYAIRAGARYFATNLDLTIPTERGIAPGNGALVGVVRTATGVEPRAAGKPQPGIFQQAARRAGSRRPLVIGDRLDTDLAGAVAAGMPGLHVLTGVSDARSAVLAGSAERPRYIAADLRGLAQPQPEPGRDAGGRWRCGAAEARVDAGRLSLVDGAPEQLRDGGERPLEVSLDAVRALCCAAWESADAGRPVDGVPPLRVLS